MKPLIRNHNESSTIRITEKQQNWECKIHRRKGALVLYHRSIAGKQNAIVCSSLYCYSIYEIIVISGTEFSKLDIVWETALAHHKLDV